MSGGLTSEKPKQMSEPLAQPKQPKLLGHPSNIANSLERKYRETLGEIKKLEAAEYEWVGVEGYKLAEDYWRKRLRRLGRHV
jgi:hypothetical protein